MAAIYQEFVARRGWLPRGDYGLVYSLARITPGTNLLAFCAGVGWRLAGTPGSVLAVAAVTIPSAALTTWMTYAYAVLDRHPQAGAAIQGALAGAAGMMAAAVWPPDPPLFQIGQQGAAGAISGGGFRAGHSESRGPAPDPGCGCHRRRRMAGARIGMNLFLLYLLLLKACVTTFNGMASSPGGAAGPRGRAKAAHRQAVSCRRGSHSGNPRPARVACGRSGLLRGGRARGGDGLPGLDDPRFSHHSTAEKAGIPGGIPAMRNAVRGLTLASAGLLAAAIVPLARQNLNGPVPALIAVASCLFLVLTGRDTLWVIGGLGFGRLAGALVRFVLASPGSVRNPLGCITPSQSHLD